MSDIDMNLYRPGWHEYFSTIAVVVATRANCSRRKIGAVLTKDNSIMSTGYNGTVTGSLNCIDGGCGRCRGVAVSGESYDECLCIHAEANAIYNAVKNGKSLENSTLYITDRPCKLCILACISSGIERIIHMVPEVNPVALPMIDTDMWEVINDNIEIYYFGEEDEVLELSSYYHV